MIRKLLYGVGGALVLSVIMMAGVPNEPQEGPARVTSDFSATGNVADSYDLTAASGFFEKAEGPSSSRQMITVIHSPNSAVSTTSAYVYHDVQKVIDGDTLSIDMDGISETVRLIGINTPETVDPRKPVECFGQKASEKAKELLSERRVRIELDLTQGERDKYSRLLAYVFRDDGLFVNKDMINEGYAYEYTYHFPYKYQREFKDAQSNAMKMKNGLWTPGDCESTQSSSPLFPALSFLPPAGGNFVCDRNAYDCADFKTHKEAQSVYDSCGGISNDVHKLDIDRDGIACENLP